MKLAQKTGMKRAVIYISEYVGNWIIGNTEPVDERVKKSRRQPIRIAVKKLDKIELEKWLSMIGVTSEDARL